jgi:hypothetical protein
MHRAPLAERGWQAAEERPPTPRAGGGGLLGRPRRGHLADWLRDSRIARYCIAIYRDGCKRSQPLSTSRDDKCTSDDRRYACAAARPISVRLEPGSEFCEGSTTTTGFCNSYTFVLLVGPGPSGSAGPSRRCQGASTRPRTSRVRLPSASLAYCDRTRVGLSSHSVQWRLVAHDAALVQHQQRRQRERQRARAHARVALRSASARAAGAHPVALAVDLEDRAQWSRRSSMAAAIMGSSKSSPQVAMPRFRQMR